MSSAEIPSPSMNGQSREGLSLPGLAAHIAASIVLWGKGYGHGTKNDCKHAIAHNVRAYQRRLLATKQIKNVWISTAALAARDQKKKIELEHAIPVGCLMNLLFFKIDQTDIEAAKGLVSKLIEESTTLVWVTKDEHGRLDQCSMPAGYDTYPWEDHLARYRIAGISLLQRWTGWSDTIRPMQDDLDIEMENDFSSTAYGVD
ncbi:hypothetical protein SAMN05216319_4520 [Duganella sp. CF402]|uniref:hypothetical protein n=1 Tax=unclassified Duganella TaxID=2636909 RepID=UPI0008AA8461|nr:MULTISPECIES: hypothetical protein [unclassified Duganella]RZT06253.1 hypothetical protein EV582_4582 [Duganella sp. BK701]SEM70462.1 hypothetical protein SAMN05216319_4520 [Duganella sp. CF402]